MDRTTEAWLEALERRHLADFTMSEVARALRALSSCYVERRSKLASGAALSSAGKRSAFALFYGPLHFLVTREIVTALPISHGSITDVIDLGCGTGAAGAGLAVASRVGSIRGFDRHPWAVSEASWTYRQFGLRHRVVQANITAHGFSGISSEARPGTVILAAYAVNELAPEARSSSVRVAAGGSCAGSQRSDRRTDCTAAVAVVARLADRDRAGRRPRRRVALPVRSAADPACARARGRTGSPRAHRALAVLLALCLPVE